MFLRNIKGYLKSKGVTGLYVGRSLAKVPPGSVVLFPYAPNVLNCGITGVLAFKGPELDRKDLPLDKLDMVVDKLLQNTHHDSSPEELDLKEHYLAWEKFLGEMRGYCRQLKSREFFYAIFIDKKHQEQLSGLCQKIEGLTEKEDRLFSRLEGGLGPEDFDTISGHLEILKDVFWSLKHEIFENLAKVRDLGRSDKYKTNHLAFGILREVNLIFNNLDRLEVRGRDSAGISLLFTLEKPAFEEFRKKLAEQDLLNEYEDRQSGRILINRSIRVSKGQTGHNLVFTYKVAAEVGRLGDNIKGLRKHVQDDRVFQHLIRLPNVKHSFVAHTRWASVGGISEANCHPLDNDPGGSFGFIHACLNGDIDNYQSLRQDIGLPSFVPDGDEVTTDTKIIPLQIEKYLKAGHPLDESFRLAVNDFEGSHAIAMHSDLDPGKMYLAQKGSGQAVFVGLAADHYVPASEIYGFVEQTSQFIKLNGEKVVEGLSGKTQGQIFILDSTANGGLEGIKAMYYDGGLIELSGDDIKETEITSRDIDRQHYPHYFLKEISESPLSVEQTIRGRLAIIKEGNSQRPQITLDESVIPPHLESAVKEKKIRKIFFIGQGTAGIAAAGCAEVLRYYLDSADIQVAAVKASELSGFMLDEASEDTLVVAISQSGTTTDTNRAIDMIKERGAFTMAIVNRRDSDITFKVDGVLYTSSGRDIEMSVASTKAYYSQIVAGSILGLRLAELTGTADQSFILSEIQYLWQLPAQMREVLAHKDEIGQSASRFAVTKKDWAIVGSGPNKIAADEIRIKLSELCYKTISSDVVEDKKHIDLSSEPLIFVCAAGNNESVIGDIIKDTAIFKAHQAVPIVVTTTGEHRFDNYADSVIHVPETAPRFAPILNTLAGHLWGYYAALAINEESRYLNDFRAEINQHIEESVEKGMDVYEILLNETFREKVAKVYGLFKERIRQNRYATSMAIQAASDLTLLLKYLAGRLPSSDFEFDFGIRGTAPNMITSFFKNIGMVINDLARPIDAIKHQAKTVTVGTSRISEEIKGLLFEALKSNGFNNSQLTASNILVLRRLQEVISEISGTTLYRIEGLNILGEPVEESAIYLEKKEGSSEGLVSRVESDHRLRGTKRIIVKEGNVFIGKGKTDNRSILLVPVMSADVNINHLLLFNVQFKKEVDVQKKAQALGGKYNRIRNNTEEITRIWDDDYLDLLAIEDLFGLSAEKISERLAAIVNS